MFHVINTSIGFDNKNVNLILSHLLILSNLLCVNSRVNKIYNITDKEYNTAQSINAHEKGMLSNIFNMHNKLR